MEVPCPFLHKRGHSYAIKMKFSLYKWRLRAIASKSANQGTRPSQVNKDSNNRILNKTECVGWCCQCFSIVLVFWQNLQVKRKKGKVGFRTRITVSSHSKDYYLCKSPSFQTVIMRSMKKPSLTCPLVNYLTVSCKTCSERFLVDKIQIIATTFFFMKQLQLVHCAVGLLSAWLKPLFQA